MFSVPAVTLKKIAEDKHMHFTTQHFHNVYLFSSLPDVTVKREWGMGSGEWGVVRRKITQNYIFYLTNCRRITSIFYLLEKRR